MRRLLALVLVVAVAAGVAVWIVNSPPDAVQRFRYPLHYSAIVRAHARNYRLDPALLAAVIDAESKFHADAESGSGAIGLMQLLPSTAYGIALHTGGANFTKSDLYNPEINVRYGSWYLRHLLDKYDDERTALAAYNAGQDNVDRWLARGTGIRFAETRAYVDHVEELKGIYREIWGPQLAPEAGSQANVTLTLDRRRYDVIMMSCRRHSSSKPSRRTCASWPSSEATSSCRRHSAWREPSSSPRRSA